MRTGLLATSALLAFTQFAGAQTPTTMPIANPADSQHFIQLGDGAELSSNVIGLDVYNNEKADIGTIKDVAMDNSGVRAYILSVGGFLGMGTHYVAVVPREISIIYHDDDKKWYATMNTTKAELTAAPEFKYQGRWGAGQN